ncbi:hypothetical protein B0H16DRAFT_1822821 [Mycena metata]|uniref:Uncharacterized protein n=1 Tax=Mycena metata TaxID=1033252 RepID=A0AAD7J6C1_9AGAR|nr:hypothetical protein B0H16DRAFT_1822821 [Mycena metata]
MFFSVILLSAALRLASATPMLRAQTTCSPLESTGVSLIGQGGAQASVPVHTVDSVVWVPTDAGFAPDVAPWSFVKSGSSFVIKHKDHPDGVLTGTAKDGNVLIAAPLTANAQGVFQIWNITCTICPPSGLANNCIFSDVFEQTIETIPPQTYTSSNCLNNFGDPELGNFTQVITECALVPDQSVFPITLDYHQ